MTKKKPVSERRKYKRFQARNGALVIIKPSDIGAGRLIDIGMGGLTFECVTTQVPSTESTRLDIIAADIAFRLYELPCQCIWSLMIHSVPTSTLHKRRCGVQFGELTQSQSSQLEYFIQNFTKERMQEE
jgi:hypothetical protein